MFVQDPQVSVPSGVEPIAEPALTLWEAAFLGVVEGVTEFLPVSSTGHLIVAGNAIGFSNQAFEVGIQSGAITAILVLYGRRVWRAVVELLKPPSIAEGERRPVNLFVLLFVAALPAALIGLMLDDIMEALLFRPSVVATTLILGGFALLWLERWLARRVGAGSEQPWDITAMTVRQAFMVGLFQCLALIPGTSRSGSTIAGGLVLGMNRAAAAEFSFLVGLPILYGACGLKLLKDWEVLTGELLPAVLVATVVSFVAAILVVVPFVAFLRRHTFAPFAWYRIVAGAVILALIWSGWLADV